MYEHLKIVPFAGCAGHQCSSWATQGTYSISPSGRVKCLKPPHHPLFYCSCSSFWLGHLALACHSLRKQCSSYRWDGLGSAIFSHHLNPQLTGSCVLENWHITLQRAYCHPQTIRHLGSKMITNEYQLLTLKD